MPSKIDQINELVSRGVEEILPSRDAFLDALGAGKRLTVYQGIDPTGPHLHLGHSTNLLLLRRFQKLGHRVILLIGDFTARIGDPSGRTSERVPLNEKEVRDNLKTYKKQAAKILDFDSSENPVEIAYNSAWLKKLTLKDVVDIASHFTVQQMLARDMFEKRMKNENPIGLHEFLYPLMQGYDSVALQVDAEVGGKDQLFNMLVGRDLVKTYLKKEKFVIATKLLTNPKTGNKLMSKSERNYIALNDPPADMYGKVMALPDEVVFDCFELCTEAPLSEIEKVKKLSARDAKAHLALAIVSMYHGEKNAKIAESKFAALFLEHTLPSDITTVAFSKEKMSIIEALERTGLASSRGEARRLVEQRGIHVKEEGAAWRTIEDPAEDMHIESPIVIRAGRRRFVKVIRAI